MKNVMRSFKIGGITFIVALSALFIANKSNAWVCDDQCCYTHGTLCPPDWGTCCYEGGTTCIAAICDWPQK
jgi:hypothetical protein